MYSWFSSHGFFSLKWVFLYSTLLHNDISQLSHGVISRLKWQAHYPSSCSNQPGLPVFWGFLQLPSSSEAYTNRLEQLLKYVWGAPREFYSQPHTKSYKLLQWKYLAWNQPPHITLIRVIWQNISLSDFIFTHLWLMKIINLLVKYFTILLWLM